MNAVPAEATAGAAGDVLSAAGLEKYLRNEKLRVQVYPRISSTNTVLKGLAAEGAAEGLALVAGEQTMGRGRMGRSFFSPADTGVYLSLLLRPAIPAERAMELTACAAVAAAEAIETLSGAPAQIKWVNDVLLDGRKVCGILTEASANCESGRMDYVVIGVGINAAAPAGGFPPELRESAGAVFSGARPPELRCRLAAEVLNRLMGYYERLPDRAFFEGYKGRSLVLGKKVDLLAPGREPIPAEVLALEPDFALLVRREDGGLMRVRSGEVSLRVGESARPLRGCT